MDRELEGIIIKVDRALDAFLECAEEFLVNLEKYKAKNINKYYREKELEFSEYVKMERYKNRVRLADTIIDPLRKFLKRCDVTVPGNENEKSIP